MVPATNLGVSGNFTIECFAYVTSEAYGPVFTSDDENIRVALDYDGYNQYVHYNNNDTTPVPANKWVHFAIVRTDGTCELYIDGVNSASWVASFDSQLWIGSSSNSWSFSDGISNLRVSDYARYTQSFTPSLPLTADSGTTLLLTDGFYGPAAEDVYTDGSPAIATRSVLYRPASAYPIISGFSSTSYLTVDTNNLFGTNGEFTIECFAYIDSSTNGRIFGDFGETANIDYNGTEIDYRCGYIDDFNLLDKWTHFAIVWDGTTHRVYFDGFWYDTYTGYPYGGPLYIGCLEGTAFSNGRISGFRISNYARYDGDFPPTLPMIEDDGTTLLITDSIANSLIESPNTKPQVTREFINYVRYYWD